MLFVLVLSFFLKEVYLSYLNFSDTPKSTKRAKTSIRTNHHEDSFNEDTYYHKKSNVIVSEKISRTGNFGSNRLPSDEESEMLDSTLIKHDRTPQKKTDFNRTNKTNTESSNVSKFSQKTNQMNMHTVNRADASTNKEKSNGRDDGFARSLVVNTRTGVYERIETPRGFSKGDYEEQESDNSDDVDGDLLNESNISIENEKQHIEKPKYKHENNQQLFKIKSTKDKQITRESNKNFDNQKRPFDLDYLKERQGPLELVKRYGGYMENSSDQFLREINPTFSRQDGIDSDNNNIVYEKEDLIPRTPSNSVNRPYCFPENVAQADSMSKAAYNIKGNINVQAYSNMEISNADQPRNVLDQNQAPANTCFKMREHGNVESNYFRNTISPKQMVMKNTISFETDSNAIIKTNEKWSQNNCSYAKSSNLFTRRTDSARDMNRTITSNEIMSRQVAQDYGQISLNQYNLNEDHKLQTLPPNRSNIVSSESLQDYTPNNTNKCSRTQDGIIEYESSQSIILLKTTNTKPDNQSKTVQEPKMVEQPEKLSKRIESRLKLNRPISYENIEHDPFYQRRETKGINENNENLPAILQNTIDVPILERFQSVGGHNPSRTRQKQFQQTILNENVSDPTTNLNERTNQNLLMYQTINRNDTTNFTRTNSNLYSARQTIPNTYDYNPHGVREFDNIIQSNENEDMPPQINSFNKNVRNQHLLGTQNFREFNTFPNNIDPQIDYHQEASVIPLQSSTLGRLPIHQRKNEQEENMHFPSNDEIEEFENKINNICMGCYNYSSNCKCGDIGNKMHGVKNVNTRSGHQGYGNFLNNDQNQPVDTAREREHYIQQNAGHTNTNRSSRNPSIKDASNSDFLYNEAINKRFLNNQKYLPISTNEYDIEQSNIMPRDQINHHWRENTNVQMNQIQSTIPKNQREFVAEDETITTPAINNSKFVQSLNKKNRGEMGRQKLINMGNVQSALIDENDVMSIMDRVQNNKSRYALEEPLDDYESSESSQKSEVYGQENEYHFQERPEYSRYIKSHADAYSAGYTENTQNHLKNIETTQISKQKYSDYKELPSGYQEEQNVQYENASECADWPQGETFDQREININHSLPNRSIETHWNQNGRTIDQEIATNTKYPDYNSNEMPAHLTSFPQCDASSTSNQIISAQNNGTTAKNRDNNNQPKRSFRNLNALRNNATENVSRPVSLRIPTNLSSTINQKQWKYDNFQPSTTQEQIPFIAAQQQRYGSHHQSEKNQEFTRPCSPQLEQMQIRTPQGENQSNIILQENFQPGQSWQIQHTNILAQQSQSITGQPEFPYQQRSNVPHQQRLSIAGINHGLRTTPRAGHHDQTVQFNKNQPGNFAQSMSPYLRNPIQRNTPYSEISQSTQQQKAQNSNLYQTTGNNFNAQYSDPNQHSGNNFSSKFNQPTRSNNFSSKLNRFRYEEPKKMPLVDYDDVFEEPLGANDPDVGQSDESSFEYETFTQDVRYASSPQ